MINDVVMCDKTNDVCYMCSIVLYEIVARKQPYIDLDVDPLAVASAVVLGRARPAVPEWTPQPLHSLMDQCWHQSLAERPPFPLILERLQRIAGDQSLIHEDNDTQHVSVFLFFPVFLSHVVLVCELNW